MRSASSKRECGLRGKVDDGERGAAALVKVVYSERDAEADKVEGNFIRSLGTIVLEEERKRGNKVNRDIEEEEV